MRSMKIFTSLLVIYGISTTWKNLFNICYLDYTLYTVMDIMDETMVAIHTFVTQKDWLNAWYALFALSEVRTSISGFSSEF